MTSSHQRLGPEVDWRPAGVPAHEPLTGRFIQLRPLNPETDARSLYEVSHPPLGDPRIWTYLFDGPFSDVEELRDYLQLAAGKDDPLFFTLVRLPQEQPQGAATYMRIVPEHGVIEIGNIWFGSPLQRTSAATEAIYLLLRHAFDDLGYRRVEWKCNALNQGSRRAAERFGFRFEGVFHQHLVVKRRNRDTAWYAITDGEWPAIRAGFQTWLVEDNFDRNGAQRRGLGELITEARGSRN